MTGQNGNDTFKEISIVNSGGLPETGDMEVFVPPDFAERLWVYMFIRELYDASRIEKNLTEKARLERDCISLALQYNLATPLTSLVVTAPADMGVNVQDKSVQDEMQSDSIHIAGVRLNTGVASSNRWQYSIYFSVLLVSLYLY